MPEARFLGIFAGSGKWQMKTDLEFIDGPVELMFRIGVWTGLAVSLGRRQSLKGKHDPRRLSARGIEVVQRPTGGLTILHHPGTITLHVYIPATHELYKRDVITASMLLAKWVSEALKGLGYNVEYYSSPPERRRLVSKTTEICMAHTGAADIYYNHKKVGAAALRRTPTGLLYQGYLVLNEPWYDLWIWVDEYPDVEELKKVIGGLGADFTLGELTSMLLEKLPKRWDSDRL